MNSITAAVLGDVSDPFFTSPATALNWKFPSYSTPGVGGTLTNMSGQVKQPVAAAASFLGTSPRSAAWTNAGPGGTELESDEVNGIGSALYLSNLTKVTDDVARMLSAQIRSRNDGTLKGDNMNATTINGTVYGNVTFVHVWWGWVLWPVIESVLAALLLVCTITVTGSRTQPQLMTSALGLVYHGLDDQTVSHIQESLLGRQETRGALGEVTRILVVRLTDDGDRGRRFVRV